MANFNIVLFNNYAPLDVFGPVQLIGYLDKIYQLEYYSEHGGIIHCSQNVRVETLPIAEMPDGGVLMIPGGFGTRTEVDNYHLIQLLKEKSEKADYVLTVCTGSALLAKTGLLDGKNATSNKLAFDWVIEQNKRVNWVRKARWIVDGKFYSSSGVSAGMDMALGFISDTLGPGVAEKLAFGAEYLWNREKENDPFSGSNIMQNIANSKIDLVQLDKLAQRPPVFTQGEKLFWNDEHISKGMLAAHLNDDWDAASRKSETIRRSCDWISTQLQLSTNAAVLDLGCGPGLYCAELSRKGYQVTGVDYSVRSIAYAKQTAEEQGLAIDYHFQDYLTLDFTGRFDLAVMIFYDLGVLPDGDRDNLLRRVGRALRPNGYFVFDLLTPASLKPEVKEWSVHPQGGFWRPGPYVELYQSFNYGDEAAGRLHIIIEDSGKICVYRIWDKLYTIETITEALEKNGFELVDVYGDLTGSAYAETSESMGVIARKR